MQEGGCFFFAFFLRGREVNKSFVCYPLLIENHKSIIRISKINATPVKIEKRTKNRYRTKMDCYVAFLLLPFKIPLLTGMVAYPFDTCEGLLFRSVSLFHSSPIPALLAGSILY